MLQAGVAQDEQLRGVASYGRACHLAAVISALGFPAGSGEFPASSASRPACSS
jgi:hypothetical protein